MDFNKCARLAVFIVQQLVSGVVTAIQSKGHTWTYIGCYTIYGYTVLFPRRILVSNRPSKLTIYLQVQYYDLNCFSFNHVAGLLLVAILNMILLVLIKYITN